IRDNTLLSIERGRLAQNTTDRAASGEDGRTDCVRQMASKSFIRSSTSEVRMRVKDRLNEISKLLDSRDSITLIELARMWQVDIAYVRRIIKLLDERYEVDNDVIRKKRSR
ncbi:MAG: hypothetical protein NZ953_04420, partial [Thaumarchaeota archaeon]|nr:hypothetical protein [Candidatus Calditenuaceae archaeon]